MAYLAIARKWRPLQFEDLVGQDHVVQTLRNSIQLERVAHAYLFSGARGVGKTSVARIFAKALRCPNAKQATPCNQCPECGLISESRSVDVVEIDGASNNGVEAVRTLRENVAYGASTGKYKIYIIDEVHMLSISAFNALLKTLEEPPPYVVFMFATTEPQKIPLTILSRCQRFDFRRLPQAQIVDRLKHILSQEKAAVDDAGLQLIATHSDGSLRDALSLLDQVLSFSLAGESQGKEITEKEVVEALGIQEQSAVLGLLQKIIDKDVPSILTVIGEAYTSGADLKQFVEQCLEETRLLYLVLLSREEKEKLSNQFLDISQSHMNMIGEITARASLVQVERMAQIFSKTAGQLAWATNPRFVLEMAAIRMTRLGELSAVEEALRTEGTIASPKTPTVVVPPRVTKTVSKPPEDSSVPSPVPSNVRPPDSPAPSYPLSDNPDSINQGWRAFVDAVMKKRPLLGALLHHANFKMDTTSGVKRVVLGFAEGSFYERQGLESRNRKEMEALVKGHFGAATELIISNAAHELSKSLDQVSQERVQTLKKETLEHPSLLKVKEALGADVIEVNVEGA